MAGKLVKAEMRSASSFEVDVADLASGIYVIKVAERQTGKLIADSKFVKQ
jgi:hypothetical protein